MPIYVLLVGCDKPLHDTVAGLVGESPRKLIAVPDPDTALNALAGVRFDVLVRGAIPDDAMFEQFLAAARKLQPGLRVIDGRKIAAAPTHRYADARQPAALRPAL
ncbi:MAG: hypothetical protein EOO78_26745, partial [Oxalobacteraceae bacterium]